MKYPMIRNAPDMKVRLSADLRLKIEDAARLNNRTMNSEIVARLEHSFRAEDVAVSPLPSAGYEKRLAQVEQVIMSMIIDARFDTLASRVTVLEKLLTELTDQDFS
jgi:hypothetical protein